jgi:hypothetical protein
VVGRFKLSSVSCTAGFEFGREGTVYRKYVSWDDICQVLLPEMKVCE